MQYVLGWSVSYTNMFEMVYSQYFPCIVASSVMEGCLESGKDVTEGGARYNRTGLTACGTANVADSLMAIKKLCFDDKTVSLREMYDALQNNWEGYEQLRQTVINEVPHYGNDNDEVDGLATWALGLFAEIMANADGARGKFSGGTFTMTAHIYIGSLLGATPDGRKAGGHCRRDLSAPGLRQEGADCLPEKRSQAAPPCSVQRGPAEHPIQSVVRRGRRGRREAEAPDQGIFRTEWHAGPIQRSEHDSVARSPEETGRVQRPCRPHRGFLNLFCFSGQIHSGRLYPANRTGDLISFAVAPEPTLRAEEGICLKKAL